MAKDNLDLRTVFIDLTCSGYNYRTGMERYSDYGDKAVQQNLFSGIYNVEKFVKNNDTPPPLATDTAQWTTLNICFAQYVVIKMMNDSAKGYSFTADTTKKTIQLKSYGDTSFKSDLSYYYLITPMRNI